MTVINDLPPLDIVLRPDSVDAEGVDRDVRAARVAISRPDRANTVAKRPACWHPKSIYRRVV